MTKITENSKSVKWMEDNSHSALFLRAQWALPWVAENTQGFLKVSKVAFFSLQEGRSQLQASGRAFFCV